MTASGKEFKPYEKTLLLFVPLLATLFLVPFIVADIPPVPSYLIGINSTVLIMWTWDKIKAIRGSSRIPEILLIAAVVLGGSAGGLLGMIVIRHKIRKVRFQVICIFSFILHALIVGWLIFGGSFLSASSSP